MYHVIQDRKSPINGNNDLLIDISINGQKPKTLEYCYINFPLSLTRETLRRLINLSNLKYYPLTHPICRFSRKIR